VVPVLVHEPALGKIATTGAARLSIGHSIAMADSIMLAIAQRNDAILWAQDANIEGLPRTRHFANT
jgi:predicted nucleic acid-binding protein